MLFQDKDDIDTGRMVARIADIFRPAELAVVTTTDCGGDALAWGAAVSPPPGYSIAGRTVQDLASGARVTFLSLTADGAADNIVATAAGASVTAACAAAGQLLERPLSPASSTTSVSGTLCPPVPQPYQGPPSAYLSDSEEGAFGSDSGDAAAAEAAQLLPLEPPVKPQPLIALGPAVEDNGQRCEAVAEVLAKYAAVPLPATDAAALDAHISALIEVLPRITCPSRCQSVFLFLAVPVHWRKPPFNEWNLRMPVHDMSLDITAGAAPGRHLLRDGPGHGCSSGGGVDTPDAAHPPLLCRQVRLVLHICQLWHVCYDVLVAGMHM